MIVQIGLGIPLWLGIVTVIIGLVAIVGVIVGIIVGASYCWEWLGK